MRLALRTKEERARSLHGRAESLEGAARNEIAARERLRARRERRRREAEVAAAALLLPEDATAEDGASCFVNPLTSLADDVEATRRILALQDGPTVLVGHSWAGMVISEAGTDPDEERRQRNGTVR